MYSVLHTRATYLCDEAFQLNIRQMITAISLALWKTQKSSWSRATQGLGQLKFSRSGMSRVVWKQQLCDQGRVRHIHTGDTKGLSHTQQERNSCATKICWMKVTSKDQWTVTEVMIGELSSAISPKAIIVFSYTIFTL